MKKENLFNCDINKNKAGVKVILKAVAIIMVIASIFTVVACSPIKNPNSSNIIGGASKNQTDSYSLNKSNTSSKAQSGTNYSKYCELTQSILKNERINNLIDGVHNSTINSSTAEFDPHPYAFLEKQGHNISAIKNGSLECRTVAYIPNDEPNSLYMLTYVESSGTKPYYTHYILKYNLTDAEVKDYNLMHGNGGTYYIQAVFMNDMISKTKKVEIVSSTKVYKETHKEMKSEFSRLNTTKNLIGTSNADFILKNFDEKTQTFDVLVIPFANANKRMSGKEKIAVMNLCAGDSFLEIENGIFEGPSKYRQFVIHPYATNEVTETRFYYPQETSLISTLVKDLRNK